MLFALNEVMSMSEANQNFSAVARKVDQLGKVVIFKNNRPKLLVSNIEEGGFFELTDDERFEIAARRVMRRIRPALLELAK